MLVDVAELALKLEVILDIIAELTAPAEYVVTLAIAPPRAFVSTEDAELEVILPDIFIIYGEVVPSELTYITPPDVEVLLEKVTLDRLMNELPVR